VRQIHQIANTWPGRESVNGHISSQDALAAYIITALNQCVNIPITKVSNVLSYRGVKNPDTLSPGEWRIPGRLALGNVIFQAFIPPLSRKESKSLGAISWAIRKSIMFARNYDHLKRVVAISNPIWLRQTTEHSEHKFWQSNGSLTVNAFTKAHFSASHFGFGADKTRNIEFGAFPGLIRMFAASPVKLADGKSWDSNEDSIWMFVRLPVAVKEKFLATIASELHSPGFPQNLVIRERQVLASNEEEELNPGVEAD